MKIEDENARTLANRVEICRNELEDALQILEGITTDVLQRETLVEQIEQNKNELAAVVEKLQPLEDALQALGNDLRVAENKVTEDKTNAKSILSRQKRVNGDVEYWQSHNDLTRLERQLKQLDDLEKDKTKTTGQLKHNRVDNRSLEDLRQAENTLQIAKSQRKVAATRLQITAMRDLALNIDTEQIELSKG